MLHCCSSGGYLTTHVLQLFNSENSVNHPLLICRTSTVTKKILARNVKHKLEETIFDGTRRDVWLEHFIMLNVPFSQQRSKLT